MVDHDHDGPPGEEGGEEEEVVVTGGEKNISPSSSRGRVSTSRMQMRLPSGWVWISSEGGGRVLSAPSRVVKLGAVMGRRRDAQRARRREGMSFGLISSVVWGEEEWLGDGDDDDEGLSTWNITLGLDCRLVSTDLHVGKRGACRRTGKPTWPASGAARPITWLPPTATTSPSALERSVAATTAGRPRVRSCGADRADGTGRERWESRAERHAYLPDGSRQRGERGRDRYVPPMVPQAQGLV